jgi:hypothetical protein
MFLFYALPIGLILGLLLGGRPSGLANLNFRWGMLAVAGFAVQLVLFSGPVSERIGDQAGPVLYVASTALVLVAVLANLRIPGMVLVAIGAASNLAAILANGGYMPASHAPAVGPDGIAVYSNTRIFASPALQPLTDVIALPDWLPFTNIASIGDLLIGAGIAIVIAASMRATRPTPPESLHGSTEPVLEGNSPV